MTLHTRVEVVSGSIYVSDKTEIPKEQAEEAQSAIAVMCKNLKKIAYFSIMREGRDIHFHPDNIVTIEVIIE
jgi:hypothetical protein